MDDERLEREAAKLLFSAPAQGNEEVARAEPQGPEMAFVCPFCQEAYQVSEELAGKKINCRNCREPCRVDAKKLADPVLKGLPFWLGVVVGAMAMALIGIGLKIAGAL
jgi:hypothetical protein